MQTALDQITVGSDLTLDEAILGPALLRRLRDFLKLETITLTGCREIKRNPVLLGLSGTLSRFLASEGPPARLRLYLFDFKTDAEPSERHCVFFVDDLPADFDLPNLLTPFTSEGGLPSFLSTQAPVQFLGASAIERPGLLFSSLDYRDARYEKAPFPPAQDDQLPKSASDLLRVLPREEVATGFNGRASSALDDTFKTLFDTVGLSSPFRSPFVARIGPEGNWFKFELTAPLGESVTLGPFELTWSDLGLVFSLHGSGQLLPSVELRGEMTLGTTVSYLAGLDLSTETLSLTFTGFPAFDDLAGHLSPTGGGFDLKSVLPDGLGPLGTVELARLGMVIYTGGPSLTEMSFVVTTEEAIRFVPGVVEVEPVLVMRIENPLTSSRRVETLIGGSWELGTTRFETQIVQSGEDYTLHAQMALGETLDMSALLAKLLPGVQADDLPGLVLLDLDLQAAFGKRYEAEIAVATDWEIAIPGTPVTLAFTELDLFAAAAPQAGGGTKLEELSVTGWFRFVESDFSITAEYDAAAGWTFVGSAAPGPRGLRLTGLFQAAGTQLGGLAPQLGAVPDDFLDVAIVGLTVIYETHPRVPDHKPRFSFYGALAGHIAVTPSLVFERLMVRFEIENGQLHGMGLVELLLEKGTGAGDLQEDVKIFLEAEKGQKGDGWQMTGSTGPGQRIPLGHLVSALARQLHLSESGIPKPVETLEILNLFVSFHTRTKDFTFRCEADFEVAANQTLDLVADVNLTHQPDGTTAKHMSGTLTVAGLEFDVLFDQDPGETAFLALYKNTGGGELSLKDLVEAVSGESVDLLDGLRFKVKDVLLIYEPAGKEPETPSKYLFALDMDFGVDLSGLGNLPLIGKLLPADQALRLAFEPVLVSDVPPSDGVRGLVPDGSPHLPDALTPGFTFVTSVRMGDVTRTLDFGADTSGSELAPARADHLDPGLGSSQPPPASVPPPDPAADLAAQPENVKWIDLQKNFGPLHVARLGLGYQDGKISALLDAALTLGPLEVALEGLGARYDLKTKDLSFALQGLSLDFHEGPVEISGAFLRFGDEFAGTALLRTEDLTLGAVGSYGELQGHPSLFLYAFLSYPIGGPVFFFVEGLAAGFGYNRRLIVPPVTEIYRFPLVAEVIAPPSAKPPVSGSGSDAAAVVRDELTLLESYVPPELDQYFLCAGVKFNSFRLIDCFALLAVDFGPPVEIDVLGVATLKVPSDSPEVLAEVDLEFAARLSPEEGYLGVQAQLTPRSYLFSRDCHLSGGCAFSSWFRGEHAGDFVYTMGGYHPDFKVPAHYPRVPRLGFNWKVDDQVTIKGDAYYALASTAAMAGGSLDARYHSGALEAWFRLGLDVLISWKPYHYEAHAHAEIGARVTIKIPFVGHVRVTVEAGADMKLWGPELAGKAHVHVGVVSFTLSFGNGSEKKPALAWDEFAQAFLPEPAKVVTVAVPGGLLREIGERWVVDPKGLRLETNTLIPAKSGPEHAQPLPAGRSVGAFGVAPMDVPAADFTTSDHDVKVDREGKDLSGDFSFLPVVKRFPRALWGETRDPYKGLNAGLVEAVAGYTVVPAKSATPGASCPVVRRNLDYEVTPCDLAPDDGRALTFEAAAGALPEVLRQVPSRRSAVLSALGFDPAKDVHLSDGLAGSFVDKPPRLVRAA